MTGVSRASGRVSLVGAGPGDPELLTIKAVRAIRRATVLLGGFLGHSGADVLLMRGTEGEPAADPRRDPKFDVYVHGELRADLSRPAQDGVLTSLPLLPRSHDAATTALYIQSVVSGEKPAPLPLTRQVECLMRTLDAIGRPATSERSA